MIDVILIMGHGPRFMNEFTYCAIILSVENHFLVRIHRANVHIYMRI
jgi:hypothetical protein